MKKLNKKSKIALILIIGIFIFSLTGCAQIRDKLKTIKGELVGIHFTISAYDHYANKTLEMEGNKVTVGVLENEANIDPSSTGYQSGVLEITVNGKQMFQVGNTVIFAEDGLDMVEDFEVPEEIKVIEAEDLYP